VVKLDDDDGFGFPVSSYLEGTERVEGVTILNQCMAVELHKYYFRYICMAVDLHKYYFRYICPIFC